MKAMPPLTAMFWPVMKLASSLARKAATLAISSGSHMRPSGMALTMLCIQSAGMPAIIGVLVGPGTMVLTRIRLGASYAHIFALPNNVVASSFGVDRPAPFHRPDPRGTYNFAGDRLGLWFDFTF